MTQENLLAEGDDTPQLDPNKDYLTEFVGDGKKYKANEDLAKAYFNADNHIKILEKRMDDLRADYLREREERLAAAKLEDLIKQLDNKQPVNQPPLTEQQPPSREVNTPSIDPEQIESLVSSKIREFESSKRQQENFNTVRTKLTERFGKNYQSVIRDQVEQLGLTDDDVNALARKSPAAFFRTLGLDQQPAQETFQAPPRNSGQFRPSAQTKHKTMSQWQEYRKANPKAYHDPKITLQMDIDSQALGEKFFDSD